MTIDFKGLIINNVNESMSHLVDNLRLVTGGHAPIHKASKQQKKRLRPGSYVAFQRCRMQLRR